MRFSTLILAIGGMAFLAGCSNMVSLNPIVTQKEAGSDAALVGVWQDGDETYVIRQAGNAYAITYLDKSSPAMKFEAWLMNAGGVELLDLVSKNGDAFQIPAHTPVRIWTEGDTLRIAFLDSEWLRHQAMRQLAAQTLDDRLVITAPGEAVRDFLLAYGTDARAHGEPGVLRRIQ